MVSQFNGTSTPKGSYSMYSAKTGDNDCNVNSSRYSLSVVVSYECSLRRQQVAPHPGSIHFAMTELPLTLLLRLSCIKSEVMV